MKFCALSEAMEARAQASAKKPEDRVSGIASPYSTQARRAVILLLIDTSVTIIVIKILRIHT